MMRLDADLVARLKEDGPGWQGRANDLLRAAVGL
ncbi:BrnA antitoxin family protein [Brytella acorum]|uniref:BrnA antitoxin family protein n=1 Tax=Brytella acorum TaxID=2959299 RepID=A0AA35UGI6_9PROT|nr:BrnA antitoxin family protein [Brytella acorum]CAI9119555.1 BrnA antitoxin family protein [Brytella acorum]